MSSSSKVKTALERTILLLIETKSRRVAILFWLPSNLVNGHCKEHLLLRGTGVALGEGI